MTLLSVELTLFVNENWIWFTAFIGANLLQSGFTNRRPMKRLLERMGTKSA